MGSDVVAAVGFCPHPPVLVPDVALGAAPELDEVRAACREAITRISASWRQLVVIGAGRTSQLHRPDACGTFAGFGLSLELALGTAATGGPVELPLSLTVGAWLVRDALGPESGAIGCSVGPDWNDARMDEFTRATDQHDVALLVMGDGSARRSTAAPGYLDDRAEGFDAKVSDALRTGVVGRLPRSLLTDGPSLLAAGAPVWDVVVQRLGTSTWDAELLYDGAPYGVGYFVAAWT